MENVENNNTKDIVKDEQQISKNHTIDETSNNSPNNNAIHSNDTKNTNKEGGYFGYYIFVFISAIIGFAMVFFATRVFILEFVKEKYGIDLISEKNIVAVIISLIAVILFMFLSLGLKRLFKKIFLSEVFLYIYIGFMTTMISIISFKFLNDNLNPGGEENSLGWMVAEVLAFIIAVTFSFFADKLVVFKSYSFMPTKLFGELGLFVSARLLTEGINILIMYIIINVLNNEPMVGKLVSSVVVIVLNYLFSKFIIFKKKKKMIENNVVDTVTEEVEEKIKEEKNLYESNDQIS